jgi:uncharacterized membrane-anchored protein YhcB (DUF1043 family)
MTLAHARSALALLGLVAGLTACNKKASECQLLIRTINPQVEKQQAISQRKVEGLEDVAAVTAEISKVASETAEKLSALDITTPELKKFSADYQQMEKDFAASAKSAADGITTGSVDVMKKLGAFDASVDAAAKKEQDIIDGVNKFCSN